MKKILFPTEFSEHAPEVFHYALEMARRFKARIICMHVYGKPEDGLFSGKSNQEMADHLMDVLVDFVEKNRPGQYAEVKIEYILEIGFPPEQILATALEEDIDLIVMGMAGKTNAIGNLFGSVASKVLDEADCPVLAIPAGKKYRWFHKMVYATDFNFRDIGILNYLKKLAAGFNAEIECLHVVEPGENELRAAVNMQMLEDTYPEKVFGGFYIKKGGLVAEINKFIGAENMGLVVMLSHKKDFLERFIFGEKTKELARKIDIPLLVFKENAYEYKKGLWDLSIL